MRKDAIVYVEHNSQVLAGNFFDDPCQRVFPVYLPPDYDDNRSYPVLYQLSGWGSTGAGLIASKEPFAKSIPVLLDSIAQNPKYACVVVFPDCSVKYGCSQYINSPVLGPYMDYVCDELVPFVAEHFSVSQVPVLRAVYGHSSGGFGAMVTCMLRPEVFGHVLSSAGDSHYQHLYACMIPTFIRTVEKYGSITKMIDAFLSKPNPMRDCSRDMGESVMLLNICQCYLPNRQAELGLDLFFDPYSGELIPDQWQKFLQWDPVYMVDQYEDAIKQLSSFSLFAGAQDEYGIHLGHRQISSKLTKKNIAHSFVEYQAGHSGIYYKMIDHTKHVLDQMPILEA
ncbi:MAG: alpha/beta hydrolase-fold protein [Bdellovibrionota bacterium]